MTEFLTHPAVVTLLMAAALTAMNVVANVAIAKLTAEQQKQGPAITATAVLAIMSAVIAVPTINHLWAQHRDERNELRERRREQENRRLAARDAHLERLRPLLRSDSKKLAELSGRLKIEGNAMSGWLVEDYERPIDQTFWYPETLYRDLTAHFPDYGKARERVRDEVFAQQKDTLDVQRLALKLVEIDDQNEKASIAITLVRQCMGRGKGMNL